MLINFFYLLSDLGAYSRLDTKYGITKDHSQGVNE